MCLQTSQIFRKVTRKYRPIIASTPHNRELPASLLRGRPQSRTTALDLFNDRLVRATYTIYDSRILKRRRECTPAETSSHNRRTIARVRNAWQSMSTYVVMGVRTPQDAGPRKHQYRSMSNPKQCQELETGRNSYDFLLCLVYTIFPGNFPS